MNETTLLMAAPNHFAINYVINPWMEQQINQADNRLAQSQWTALKQAIESYAKVIVIDSDEELPDLCFTANAALMHKKRAILSRFRPQQRQPEEAIFRQWLLDYHFEVIDPPEQCFFEGAGDALINHEHTLCWFGYGFRSDDIRDFISEQFNLPVAALKLTNPYFYHLDTCFCPLIDGHIMYYPDAFDDTSLNTIKKYSDSKKHILVSRQDAEQFSCNAISINTGNDDNPTGVIILNDCSDRLKQQLETIGYQVITTPTSEFIKAGGSTKCLCLQVN